MSKRIDIGCFSSEENCEYNGLYIIFTQVLFYNRCYKLLTVERGAADRSDRGGVAHLAVKEQVNSAAKTVRPHWILRLFARIASTSLKSPVEDRPWALATSKILDYIISLLQKSFEKRPFSHCSGDSAWSPRLSSQVSLPRCSLPADFRCCLRPTEPQPMAHAEDGKAAVVQAGSPPAPWLVGGQPQHKRPTSANRERKVMRAPVRLHTLTFIWFQVLKHSKHAV